MNFDDPDFNNITYTDEFFKDYEFLSVNSIYKVHPWIIDHSLPPQLLTRREIYWLYQFRNLNFSMDQPHVDNSNFWHPMALKELYFYDYKIYVSGKRDYGFITKKRSGVLRGELATKLTRSGVLRGELATKLMSLPEEYITDSERNFIYRSAIEKLTT